MSLVMRAGDYYIGDLCYVMHGEWQDVCNLLFEGRDDHGCNEGTFNLPDGRAFALFNTAYGDGYYSDNKGKEYPVDAGSIGCIRVEDIRENSGDKDTMPNDKTLGNIYSFENDFEVYSDGRVLTFGDVEIDTDPYADDYDED